MQQQRHNDTTMTLSGTAPSMTLTAMSCRFKGNWPCSSELVSPYEHPDTEAKTPSLDLSLALHLFYLQETGLQDTMMAHHCTTPDVQSSSVLIWLRALSPYKCIIPLHAISTTCPPSRRSTWLSRYAFHRLDASPSTTVTNRTFSAFCAFSSSVAL